MGKTIQLKADDGHQLDAYVAEPSGKPRGAVIVVQEIFGVNSHIRSVTDGFAADGYLAIAPAMFDRAQKNYEGPYTPESTAKGVEIMKSLSFDNALLDVKAAIAHGKSAGKVGLVGYCWGGTVAWLAATRLSGLEAVVSYYGGGIPNFVDETPRVPIILQFGEADQSITVDKARAAAAKHPDIPAYYYKDAGHGFNCDQRASYNEAASKEARTRTIDFLRKHVG